VVNEIITEDELKTAVDQATSEEEFDALAYFSGDALPEASVTTYANAKAAYRLAELADKQREQAELEASEGLGITDEVEYIDPDEIDELKRKLTSSAIVFKLRGLAPAAKTALERKARASNPFTEGAENEEYNEAFNASLIASTIVSVSNATGKQDKNVWDADRVLAFSKVAPESEFSKLYVAVLRVNYIGDAIDQAVNADF
jgi:hypothetical protein